MIYQFGAFIFDTDRFELTNIAGEKIQLQPRTKELLRLFLKKGTGRLLAKEDIIAALWDGRQVSEAALLSQIKRLRNALDDTDRIRSVIGTVHAKGWRLLPEVVSSMRMPVIGSDNDAPALPADPARIGECPVIAVLPFRLTGSLRSPRAGMSHALPDDIISALSRLRMLSVIARGTSFQFSGDATSPSVLRKALGVDYTLNGAVDVTGPKLIISTELADACSDKIVWTDRFEIDPRAIHEIRTHVVGRIVQEIEQQVPRHEAERLRLGTPQDLTAWQSFHLGSSLIYRSGIANNELAQKHFKRAVSIDPGFSRAHAGLSHTYWWLLLQRTLDDPGDAPELMLRSAQAASDADPDDPSAALAMGKALALGERVEQAPRWLELAIDLSPSYAMAHTQIAIRHAFLGPFEDTMKHGRISLALSPRDPMRYSTYAAQAIAQFNLGNILEAADWARMALSVPHEDVMIMVSSMSIIFVAGDKEGAARASEHIRQVFPGVTIAGILRANPWLGDNVRPVLQAVLAQNGFQ